MAPRETPKPLTKMQRKVKDTPSKSQASPIKVIKKTVLSKNTAEKTSLKITNSSKDVRTIRQRTSTVPKVFTPKPLEKTISIPASEKKNSEVSKLKRRPKRAHSGVPVPDKMKKLIEKQLLNAKRIL